jgi:hypothetical protein
VCIWENKYLTLVIILKTDLVLYNILKVQTPMWTLPDINPEIDMVNVPGALLAALQLNFPSHFQSKRLFTEGLKTSLISSPVLILVGIILADPCIAGLLILSKPYTSQGFKVV